MKHKKEKKEYSLKNILTFSFVIIALVLVFVTGFLSNKAIKDRFAMYIQKEQEGQNEKIVNLIVEQYKRDGYFDKYFYQVAFSELVNDGLIVSIFDRNTKVVFDARQINVVGCSMMMKHVSNNMKKVYPDLDGEFITQNYDVVVDAEVVGSITIESYGPFYFKDNDLMYLKNLNKTFTIIGIIAFIFAIGIGFFISEKISKPIRNLINLTNLISKGNYLTDKNKKSNIKEINELIDSVNDMSLNLENQKTLRKQLTADISHELRTPVTTIQSHFESMMDGIWEPTIERISSCHEEIVRLGNTISDLDKLNNIEEESFSLNKINFDINQMIKNLIILFEAEAKNKDINIFYDEKQLEIFADKEKINQVIFNILSNAIKYTNENGEINISVEQDNKNILIDVSDNGIGISDDDIKNIFERFYRGEKSRNRATGGVGIGLSIASAIVKEHGGEIIAKSKLGIGSTFKIILPIN